VEFFALVIGISSLALTSSLALPLARVVVVLGLLVSDPGGKMVASRRQNRVCQLKDTWLIGFCVYKC
jgi:hypothetical protein